MNRLTLLLTGLLFVLLALLSVWMTSVPGHLTLAGMGFSVAGLEPTAVQLPFLTLFALGYIFLAGNLFEGLTGAVASALVGGHTISTQKLLTKHRRSPEIQGPVIWGVAAYLGVALGFALLLIFLSQPEEQNVARLLDPAMLKTTLTWPWHLLAAFGTFGLSPSDFYSS